MLERNKKTYVVGLESYKDQAAPVDFIELCSISHGEAIHYSVKEESNMT